MNLVHLGIPLPLFVLGGAGRCDQKGIDDCALVHCHASFAVMGFNGVKDMLTKLIFLWPLVEGQDCRFIRDPVADEVDPHKPPRGGHLNEGLFYGRIAEGMSLLKQVNFQHSGQPIGRATDLLAGFWGNGA